MFSSNKLPKDFRFFFFLGQEEEEEKRIQGEKKETHQEHLPHVYVYLCKCSTEDIFHFSGTKPHRSAAAPSTTTTTMMTMMMMMHVCAEAGVADAASLFTPITSEMEKLDLHKHYLHYSHSLKNSSRY